MVTYRNIYQDSIEPFVPRTGLRISLFTTSIKAGFPSPAEDYVEKTLDFNEYLVKHPAATFCLRVSGSSMVGAGIHHNDILVVDRSLTAKHNNIIIGVVSGELTVKRLIKKGGQIILMPENPDFTPIHIKDGMDFEVWGVVTAVIHNV